MLRARLRSRSTRRWKTCDQVTATATDEFGTTSEFALNGRAGMCSTYAMPPIVEPYLTVNTTSNRDDGVCNEEHCSLREAINQANSTVGGDTISFDIDGLVPHQIVLPFPLPRLTDDRTFIDGTSEPDYAGSPVVWLVSEEENVGLYIDSQRNTIRGPGADRLRRRGTTPPDGRKRPAAGSTSTAALIRFRTISSRKAVMGFTSPPITIRSPAT